MPHATFYNVTIEEFWRDSILFPIRCADISRGEPIALIRQQDEPKIRLEYDGSLFLLSGIDPELITAIRGCPENINQFVLIGAQQEGSFWHGQVATRSLATRSRVIVPGLKAAMQIEWLNPGQVVIRDSEGQVFVVGLATGAIFKLPILAGQQIQSIQVDVARKILYCLKAEGIIVAFQLENFRCIGSYDVGAWDVLPTSSWAISKALEGANREHFAIWVSSTGKLVYFDFNKRESRTLIEEGRVDFLTITPDNSHIAYVTRDEIPQLIISSLPPTVMRPVCQIELKQRHVMAMQFISNEKLVVIYNKGALVSYKF